MPAATTDVRSEEEGLAEPSGLKWSRSYIHWRGYREGADALYADFGARADKIDADRTRTNEWRAEQRRGLRDQYRGELSGLTAAWERRFEVWEAEARRQGRAKPPSAAAEATRTRAGAELRLLVPNTEVPDLAERFEDALLREVPGEVEAWLTALPAMVKTTTAPQQRQSTPREQRLQAHAADLLARVAEVSAARMPENVKLANDNLAWLDMNHREFTREREWLVTSRAELGQEASWLDLVGRPA